MNFTPAWQTFEGLRWPPRERLAQRAPTAGNTRQDSAQVEQTWRAQIAKPARPLPVRMLLVRGRTMETTMQHPRATSNILPAGRLARGATRWGAAMLLPLLVAC